MATSSRMDFNLGSLSEKALQSIDTRIAEAQLELDSYLDDDALDQKIKDWRARQDTRIAELAERVASDEMDDVRLSNWKIEPMPSVDRYDRRAAEARLRDLKSLRARVEAKATSLVADENGNVSLTKTQLRDFFAL